MKYENIVFDFGNVIAKFNGKQILRHFYPADSDFDKIFQVVFREWGELDKGIIDYQNYADESAAMLPSSLTHATEKFFQNWPEHLTFIPETLELISQLKEQNRNIYLLSNAPVKFADWALKNCPFFESFSGIVFSAPIKMAKPMPEIYLYLFEHFQLDPKTCFFIDDLEKNINAGRSLGMDGIIFKDNINEVKAALKF